MNQRLQHYEADCGDSIIALPNLIVDLETMIWNKQATIEGVDNVLD